ESVETCQSLFTILAVATGGIWFVTNAVLRRQEDVAVEFTASATTLPESINQIALVANVKNLTTIGAGIKSLEWTIFATGKHATIENEPLSGNWILPKKKPDILTRNASWQLVHIIDVRQKGAYKLVAHCCIDWQPSEQTIRHE